MATKLARVKLEGKLLTEITDEKFVREAKQLLGYKVLDSAWTFKKVVEILAKLGIEPFDEEKVKAYKKEKQDSVYTRTRKSNDWGTTSIITKGEWVSVPLSGYKKEVPAFALLRAAQIKKELNKAKLASSFSVEELQTKTSRSEVRKMYDPFMVLEVGERRLYLDVWDEPKFEGRRTK